MYLASRKCEPIAGEPWPSDLGFTPPAHSQGSRCPALLAVTRDILAGERTGIQRIALKDDGAGKREMPNGMNSKMMLGPCKSAAVMLHSTGRKLGIAEGIETSLSAHRIFKAPVWAAMSAGGIRDFPVIYGIRFLWIFADHDDAGLLAARCCKRRYKAAGIEVEIRYPPKPQSDWNDHLEEA